MTLRNFPTLALGTAQLMCYLGFRCWSKWMSWKVEGYTKDSLYKLMELLISIWTLAPSISQRWHYSFDVLLEVPVQVVVQVSVTEGDTKASLYKLMELIWRPRGPFIIGGWSMRTLQRSPALSALSAQPPPSLSDMSFHEILRFLLPLKFFFLSTWFLLHWFPGNVQLQPVVGFFLCCPAAVMLFRIFIWKCFNCDVLLILRYFWKFGVFFMFPTLP